MKNIKIIGLAIALLLMALLVISGIKQKHQGILEKNITSLKKQKEFTQEISKSIFFLSKNHNHIGHAELNKTIKRFLNNINDSGSTNKEMTTLWNRFYLDVQRFRDNINHNSIYSKILLDKEINELYMTNLKLVVELEKLIRAKESKLSTISKVYMIFEYGTFAIIAILLTALFLELRTIFGFIQRFLDLSKSLLLDSSLGKINNIKRTKTDEHCEADVHLHKLATQVDESIQESIKLVELSQESLVGVEKNVEKLLNLVFEMSQTAYDAQLRKKEDSIIETLDELGKSKLKLQQLQDRLTKFI